MEIKGRRKKSVANIILALISQVATVIFGMLLPRALMLNYGSATNGLISSLQQLVSYLTLIEGGLLSAVAVSLYKPLAQNDTVAVNQILVSAKYYYRRTGLIYSVALISCAAVYPALIANTQYPYWQVVIMVLLVGVNGLSQILLIGKYKALLMAAQMNGILLCINAVSTALYSIILIMSASLQIHPLISLSLAVTAYWIRSLMFYLTTKRAFPQYSYSGWQCNVAFPQRADALKCQIFGMISLHGGVIVLSFFKAPMELVSVYTTYNFVLSGLYMLMYSVENSITATLGNLIASESPEKVRVAYDDFDSAYHILLSIIISCLSALLLPFIEVYTSGIHDAEYILPFESVLFIAIGAAWMLRNQQTLLLTAKGRFNDMRNPMLIEASIVIIGGGIAYCVGGLKGILIAKLLATVFVLCILMYHNYNSILTIKMSVKIKRICLSITVAVITTILSRGLFGHIANTTFYVWIVEALLTAVIAAIMTMIVWWIFARKDLIKIQTILVNILPTRKLVK